MQNYIFLFSCIVPIEKGQAILTVLLARHPLKRCKYEFLPHTMSDIEKFLLDPTVVSHCADGI